MLTLLLTVFDFRCRDSCGTGAETAEREGAPTVHLHFLFEATEAETVAACTRPEEVRATPALAAFASLAQSLSALATALAAFVQQSKSGEPVSLASLLQSQPYLQQWQVSSPLQP